MLAACTWTSTPPLAPTPTPDMPATVEARVAATIAAQPTPTPTPTPDIPATVQAAVRAAIPTPMPTPTRTPDPAVVFAQMVEDARDSVVRISHDQGVGSGVIFEVAAGTAAIATNHHVVEGRSTVNVTVGDRDTYTGFVRGTDAVQDIAVVAICCGDFHALPFADPATVRVGDEIVLMGYALDLRGEATLTRGVISAIRFSDSHQSMVVQTDAAMNPGNSGGPMLNLDGEIVGINTFGISETRGGRSVEGLGFAISVETVRPRALFLKTQIAPVPTPTPTPRPTPTPQSVRLFGPQDVALHARRRTIRARHDLVCRGGYGRWRSHRHLHEPLFGQESSMVARSLPRQGTRLHETRVLHSIRPKPKSTERGGWGIGSGNAGHTDATVGARFLWIGEPERSSAAARGANGGLKALRGSRCQDRRQQETLASGAGVSLRGRSVG